MSYTVKIPENQRENYLKMKTLIYFADRPGFFCHCFVRTIKENLTENTYPGLP